MGIIISAYTCCGKTYAYKKYNDKYKIRDLCITDFLFSRRLRTEEELEKEKEMWESTPHLLSGEGYINRIKYDKIIVPNKEFPNNLITYFKENIDKEDIIFIDLAPVDINHLLKQNFNEKFYIVLPKEDLMNEWLGRLFTSNKEYLMKLTKLNWRKIIIDIDEDLKDIVIRLGSNQYMDLEFLEKVLDR